MLDIAHCLRYTMFDTHYVLGVIVLTLVSLRFTLSGEGWNRTTNYQKTKGEPIPETYM